MGPALAPEVGGRWRVRRGRDIGGHEAHGARAPGDRACTNEGDGDQIVSLAAGWVRAFLSACSGVGQDPRVDEESLLEILQAGRASLEAGDTLETLGACLPAGTAVEVTEAILQRLVEAKQSGEAEMFTAEPIFEAGSLRRGMAAVLRRSGRDGRLHVFLYDQESIRTWQRTKRKDPMTREVLKKEHILSIERIPSTR